MTRDELDRALEEALNVEPTAGYATKVRARIASERAASAVSRPWWPAVVVAAAVLELFGGGLMLERQESPIPAATVTAPAGKIASAGADGRTAAPAQQATSGERATDDGQRVTGWTEVDLSRRPHVGAAPTSGDLPGAIVSPDDAAGLRLLVTLVQTSLPAPATDSGDREGPLQIGRIDVVPIQVDPLPQPTPVTIGELQ